MYNTTLTPAILAPDNWSYKEREWRAPPVNPDEELIFDEPGRVLGRDSDGYNGTDYRSHYFIVVKPKYGQHRLRVRHGGGVIELSLGYRQQVVDALGVLDSDARYLLLFEIMKIRDTATSVASGVTAAHWRDAFASGRLRKRKQRDGVTVWIEPKVEQQ